MSYLWSPKTRNAHHLILLVPTLKKNDNRCSSSYRNISVYTRQRVLSCLRRETGRGHHPAFYPKSLSRSWPTSPHSDFQSDNSHDLICNYCKSKQNARKIFTSIDLEKNIRRINNDKDHYNLPHAGHASELSQGTTSTKASPTNFIPGTSR